MKNSISQTIEGVKYENLSSVADTYGLTRNCIYKRYSRGRRGDDLIPEAQRKNFRPPVKPDKKKFVVASLEFENVADACRKRDINYGVYRARRRLGWSPEEALNIVPKTDGRKCKRQTSRKRTREKIELVVFGTTFRSYKDLAEFAGLKGYVVRQRITTYGMSPEEAILMDGKKKKVTVGSKEFESKAQFAREAEIDERDVYSLLKRHNPKQIIEGAHKITAHTIQLDGEQYSSLRELANAHGLTYGQLKYRLEVCDGDLKKALQTSNLRRIVDSLFGKAAHFYVAEILDGREAGSRRYKIGVTQHHLEKRYGEFPFECRTVFSKDGNLDSLRTIEKTIKLKFQDYRVRDYTAADLDGFTEIYCLDKRQLNLVKFLARFGEAELRESGAELPLSA